MAFALPRKVKSKPHVAGSALSLSTVTKIPVPSPTKQRPHETSATTLPDHGARLIPSRYMQTTGNRRALTTPNEKPASVGASNRPVPGSPSKTTVRSSTARTLDTAERREVLSLRILQRSDTCHQGVIALAELKKSAETKLERKWEDVKRNTMQHQLRLASVRMHDDLQELSALSTSEIGALETFIGRLKELQGESARLVEQFESWSLHPSADTGHDWDRSAQQFDNSCRSTRLTVVSLLERAGSSSTSGVVCSAVNACGDLLDTMRAEIDSLRHIAKEIWRDECCQIAEQYDALDLSSLSSSIVRPIWETM